MTVLRTIHLHGRLRREFGPQFKLAVETPAEAFRALIHQIPRFREAIGQGEWRIVRGDRKQGMALDGVELGLRFGRTTDLHVIPLPKGAKDAGTTKVIIGVVLLVAAIFTYGATAGMFVGAEASLAGAAMFAEAAPATMGISTIVGSGWASQLAVTAGLMGASMALQGISMLLAPQPKPAKSLETEQRRDSFVFSGPVNSSGQGQPVPLIYGRVRVGSIVGAATLKTEVYSVTPAASQQASAKSGVGILLTAG
jgi:predicted phage tail protein